MILPVKIPTFLGALFSSSLKHSYYLKFGVPIATNEGGSLFGLAAPEVGGHMVTNIQGHKITEEKVTMM